MHLNTRLSSGIEVSLRERDDWGPFGDVFVAGDYDRAISAAITTHRSGPLRVMDLGANKGFFTLRFCDMFTQLAGQGDEAEIVLVEASPRLIAEIPDRLSSIARERLKTRILHGLAGERSGVGSLAVGAGSDSSHVISEHTSHDRDPAVCNGIPYVDLDELYPAPTVVDLLKCDIEGSEYSLIRNYRSLLSRTRILAVELHGSVRAMQDAEAVLSDTGFNLLHGRDLVGKVGVRTFSR